MTDIFISHATADKALADKFVAFLKEAIGVPAKAIFCSSIDGQNIPLGVDFNQYMKEQIQEPKLVILLLTPRYMESWFCLMELGATWAKSHRALPIVVPPVSFDAVTQTLGLKQGWRIDNPAKIIDLRIMIKDLGIDLEHRTEHDWENKKATWNASLKRLLEKVAPATSVTASDHQAVKDRLEAVEAELSHLQSAYSEATETIDELSAARHPDDVKVILDRKGGLDVEAQFDELAQAVKEAKPRVIDTYFYQNMIMDLYGKAAPIDWNDSNQSEEATKARSYSIIEKDFPFDYLWSQPKLKRVEEAVRAMERFLDSEEASAFVQARVALHKSMDVGDLEFWESIT